MIGDDEQWAAFSEAEQRALVAQYFSQRSEERGRWAFAADHQATIAAIPTDRLLTAYQAIATDELYYRAMFAPTREELLASWTRELEAWRGRAVTAADAADDLRGLEPESDWRLRVAYEKASPEAKQQMHRLLQSAARSFELATDKELAERRSAQMNSMSEAAAITARTPLLIMLWKLLTGRVRQSLRQRRPARHIRQPQ